MIYYNFIYICKHKAFQTLVAFCLTSHQNPDIWDMHVSLVRSVRELCAQNTFKIEHFCDLSGDVLEVNKILNAPTKLTICFTVLQDYTALTHRGNAGSRL